jgi:L-lactate dehydrogenase (cytochrome)
MSKLDKYLNIEDLRGAAKRRAHRMVFDYIDGGADDEVTLGRNTNAFDDYDLLFKVLAGVENVDMSTSLLGEQIDVPFFASPAAGHRLFHTHGERGVAKAADQAGTIFSLSTLSSVSIEEIAALTTGPKWFQLYVWKDRGLVKEMMDRAREAGYKALILTVDFPIAGNRERDSRNGFSIPPKVGIKQAWHALMAPAWSLDYVIRPSVKYANLSKDTAAVSLQDFVFELFDAGFNWRDAEWLLGEWNGPSVIKGVVRPDDARKAVDLGFNAVMVSNHGGRQLDRSPAPVDVLEPIIDAVGADAEVILDGGVRRGTDILIALALGAKAVGFARPFLYGLAAAGEAGAYRAMEILTNELRRDMVLLGTDRVSEIKRSLVKRRRGS